MPIDITPNTIRRQVAHIDAMINESFSLLLISWL